MRFNETLLHDSAKTQTRAIAKNTMLIPGTEYHFIVEVEFRYQKMWNLIACLLVYLKSLSEVVHQPKRPRKRFALTEVTTPKNPESNLFIVLGTYDLSHF